MTTVRKLEYPVHNYYQNGRWAELGGNWNCSALDQFPFDAMPKKVSDGRKGSVDTGYCSDRSQSSPSEYESSLKGVNSMVNDRYASTFLKNPSDWIAASRLKNGLRLSGEFIPYLERKSSLPVKPQFNKLTSICHNPEDSWKFKLNGELERCLKRIELPNDPSERSIGMFGSQGIESKSLKPNAVPPYNVMNKKSDDKIRKIGRPILGRGVKIHSGRGEENIVLQADPPNIVRKSSLPVWLESMWTDTWNNHQTKSTLIPHIDPVTIQSSMIDELGDMSEMDFGKI